MYVESLEKNIKIKILSVSLSTIEQIMIILITLVFF